MEGGYVNHKSDVGGETKFGISKRYNPDIDVKNLTEEQAFEIYIQRYWKTSYAPLWYSSGYDGIAFIIFDVKVSGQRAVLYDAQRIINTYSSSYGRVIKVDGHLGPGTLDAFRLIHNELNELQLISKLKDLAPSTASRVAQATMRSQARLGLPLYDYSKGFTNRMVKRCEYAEGLCNV